MRKNLVFILLILAICSMEYYFLHSPKIVKDVKLDYTVVDKAVGEIKEEKAVKEEKEFQAMFENKMWAVRDIKRRGENFLIFDSLEGDKFVCDVSAVDVSFDESLDGTYVIVWKVGHMLPTRITDERTVGHVILVVKTRANQKRWNEYLIKIKKDIEIYKAPREVSPPQD